jgi:diguanylate cyclase (GGDEF)-like protein
VENKKELIAITNEVKRQISDIEIVTPLLYKKLFYNQLTTHNIKYENEDIIVDNIFDEQLSKLNELNKNTSENVVRLDNNTKDAIKAIKSKDETKLEKVLEEIADLRYDIEKLKSSIFKDTLTKAYNRQWFYSNYMDGSECFIRDGILVFIDMNYFKDINDNYGHLAGDKVLEFASLHLKKTKADLVRYGGDEFLLLFDNDNLKEVKCLMELNREQITHKELRFRGYSFRTNYSYGIVPFKINDNFQDILSSADSLMYEDKKSFKQKYVVCEISKTEFN